MSIFTAANNRALSIPYQIIAVNARLATMGA
jgi:hypothetical protein